MTATTSATTVKAFGSDDLAQIEDVKILKAAAADAPTIALVDAWHTVKAEGAAAEKAKKAADARRAAIAAECDSRLTNGQIVQRHGEKVGAVAPLVEVKWDVCAYDVAAKAAVLDGLLPFLTDDQRAMYDTLVKANTTPVRKLAFKPVK
jgi:hypothetical protein